MAQVNEEDKDFIIAALNSYWNQAADKLSNSKELGDMEKAIYIKQVERCKNVMRALGEFV